MHFISKALKRLSYSRPRTRRRLIDDEPPIPYPGVQFLPAELLLQILGYLSDSMYSDAFKFTRYYPAIVCVRNQVRGADSGQAALVSASLVCKTWCSQTTELLYSRPFLISLRAVESFATTIYGSPELAGLVKDICILEQVHQHLSRYFRTELIKVLRACESLRSLTVTNRDRSFAPILPIDNLFVQASSISDRLRKLTIYGSMYPCTPNFLPILTKNVSLPALEVLCIREASLQMSFKLPHLPRLHTLRMAQCHTWSGNSFQISAEQLPQLRTLELYETLPNVTLDDKTIDNLERFHFVGEVQPGVYQPSSRKELQGASLRHLAIGNVHCKHYGVDWQIGSQVETLQVFASYEILGESIEQLGILNLFQGLDRECSKLREFTLWIGPQTPITSFPHLRAIWNSLKEACDDRGIALQSFVDEQDAYITSRLLADRLQ